MELGHCHSAMRPSRSGEAADAASLEDLAGVDCEAGVPDGESGTAPAALSGSCLSRAQTGVREREREQRQARGMARSAS